MAIFDQMNLKINPRIKLKIIVTKTSPIIPIRKIALHNTSEKEIPNSKSHQYVDLLWKVDKDVLLNVYFGYDRIIEEIRTRQFLK